MCGFFSVLPHMLWYLFKKWFYSISNFHIAIGFILPLEDEHIASTGSTAATIKPLESTAMWTNHDVSRQKLGERLVTV